MTAPIRRGIQVLAKRILATKNVPATRPAISCIRSFAAGSSEYESNSVHFRLTSTPHPLATETNNLKAKIINKKATLSELDSDGNVIAEVILLNSIANCYLQEAQQSLTNHVFILYYRYLFSFFIILCLLFSTLHVCICSHKDKH